MQEEHCTDWVRLGSVLAVTVCALVLFSARAYSESAVFVGSEVCADCHDSEYQNYSQFSKKAHSGESVRIMAKDLTPAELKECFQCHTTGYGQPGGFESFEKTPEMADAGCEVCHGPGSLHVEERGDPDLIKGDLDIKDCETCHNPDRVRSFGFKPMLFGGAH
ncbi:Cytochrome c554 and c-prime [Paucidesulfovibrio gracilis DSM 16080]|uniref:Cytochrome c554 and c-prime n=1 Tax=Paucidesulfovibrio gracilis DSM 16080 TaxID=1121449 RepID=A0A1T4X335_9BACT|nr:cytochrome c family protein [Paucidesulfovibrio gracilis]SKA83578.1 Cytochrome c554 and c-prime [Paucidesulfovibrio gracilis DSM 16080]